MKTTLETLTMMCLAGATFMFVGCAEEHPDGELNGGICLEGQAGTQPYLDLVTDATHSVRVGRTRYLPQITDGSIIFPEIIRYETFTCDVSEPAVVDSVSFTRRGMSSLDVSHEGEYVNLLTSGSTGGSLRVFVEGAYVDVEVRVVPANETSVQFLGRSFFDSNYVVRSVVPVLAGARVPVVVDYYGGGSEILEGDTAWPEQELWTKDYGTTVAFEPLAITQRVNMFRVTDVIGDYTIEGPAGSDFMSAPEVRVVEPDEVASVVLCTAADGSVCVEGGKELPAAFFNDGPAGEISFRPVFRAADGRDVFGLPDDLEVTYSGGFEEPRDEAGLFWHVTPTGEQDSQSTIEVTAYGVTTRFVVNR